MSDRKSAVVKQRRNAKRVPGKDRTRGVKITRPVILRRKSRGEFSCGVDFDRAILIEESLDERERRG